MRLAVAATVLTVLTACAPPPLTDPADAGGSGADTAPSSDGTGDDVPFTRVADILRNDCTGNGCHGEDAGNAGLRIKGGADATDQQVRQALEGKTVAREDTKFIVPGQPDESALYQALEAQKGRTQMPLTGKLDASKIEDIRRWIAQGAPYE